MKKKISTRSAFFNPRALIAFALCFTGVALALFASFPVRRSLGEGGSPLTNHVSLSSARNAPRYMPVPGANSHEEAAGLARLEQYWNDRLTYPTGRFNPKW